MQCSGSQPGIRIPPGVRDKSQGVRQILIITTLLTRGKRIFLSKFDPQVDTLTSKELRIHSLESKFLSIEIICCC